MCSTRLPPPGPVLELSSEWQGKGAFDRCGRAPNGTSSQLGSQELTETCQGLLESEARLLTYTTPGQGQKQSEIPAWGVKRDNGLI